jgi:hypothetical protein
VSVIQIVLLIMQVLRALRNSASLEEFKASAAAKALTDSEVVATGIGDGDFLKWVWDNREEIIKFIVEVLIPIFTGNKEEADVVLRALED